MQPTGSTEIETEYGVFRAHLYRDLTTNHQHIAWSCGEITAEKAVSVRVHTGQLINDLASSKKSQLNVAFKALGQEGGVLLYLKPNDLEESLLDECLEDLHAPKSSRTLTDYGLGAQILHDLGVRKINLLTNTPKSMRGLEGYGLEIVSQSPLGGAEELEI